MNKIMKVTSSILVLCLKFLPLLFILILSFFQWDQIQSATFIGANNYTNLKLLMPVIKSIIAASIQVGIALLLYSIILLMFVNKSKQQILFWMILVIASVLLILFKILDLKGIYVLISLTGLLYYISLHNFITKKVTFITYYIFSAILLTSIISPEIIKIFPFNEFMTHFNFGETAMQVILVSPLYYICMYILFKLILKIPTENIQIQKSFERNKIFFGITAICLVLIIALSFLFAIFTKITDFNPKAIFVFYKNDMLMLILIIIGQNVFGLISRDIKNVWLLIILSSPYWFFSTMDFYFLRKLQLIDTHLALALPFILSIIPLFSYKYFSIKTIPNKVMQLIVPFTITTFSVILLYSNMFFWPLFTTNSLNMKTLTIAIASFQGLFINKPGIESTLIPAIAFLQLIPLFSLIMLLISFSKILRKGNANDLTQNNSIRN